MGGRTMPRQEPGEPYFRISVDEANTILEKESNDVLVVDVRRDDEWESGHVKGAVHIPVDELMDRMGELSEEKKLLFICAQGVRSGLACEIAISMGFSSEKLFNIEDGTPAWVEKEYPTSYGNES